MSYDSLAALVLGLMAAVTLLTRTAGYWLGQRLRDSARAGRVLQLLPCAVLGAIVAPSATSGDAARLLGTLAAAALYLATHRTLVAIAGGAVLTAALRL
jgi:uncharacterized membrane protein